jgi:hypothetical protein
MKNAIEIKPEEPPVSGFHSEEDEVSLLEMENEFLKDKLGLSDFCSYFAKDMNPLNLNRLLSNILYNGCGGWCSE